MDVAQRFRNPLILVAAATLLGQIATFALRPTFSDQFYDSGNYLAVAHQMVLHHQFFNALRAPIYPGYLAIFLALPFPQPLQAAIVGQAILMVAAIGECLVLALRLGASRWGAATAAALVGLNPYILQWERAINSEGLALWFLVTCFLLVERALRVPNLARLVPLALVLALLLLTRPFYLFLPPLVFGALVLHHGRQHAPRRTHGAIILAAGLCAMLLLAYMTGNRLATGYFGLSSASNINLFGKVLTYHLWHGTADPRYARLVADIDAYIHLFPQTGGFVDPWPFLYHLHPEYMANGGQLIASYSQAVIRQNPTDFVGNQVQDVLVGWHLPPVLYGGQLAVPGHQVLQAATAILFHSYDLLPLIFLVALGLAWRRPTSPAPLLVALLAATLMGAIVMTGGFSYDPREYFRLRAPLDWAMMVLAVLGAELSLKHITPWWQALIIQRQRIGSTPKEALAHGRAQTK